MQWLRRALLAIFEPLESIPWVGNLFDGITDWLERNNLGLTMQLQQQSEWCWAAVATSVARFFDAASTWTQCAVVDAELGLTTCCTNGASAACNQPWFLDRALTRVNHFDHWNGGAATRTQVVDEIEGGRPLGVRVGWSGGGGHFLVIDGYDEDAEENDANIVEVRDPFYGTSRLSYDDLLSRYESSGSWTDSYWTKA
jgi:hypothetical protein